MSENTEITTTESKELGSTPTGDEFLKELVDKCEDDIDICSLVSTNTTDNMKAFLIVYARSSLTRVIKLTEALKVLEDQMIEDAVTNMHKYTPDQMIRMYTTIHNSLTSAIQMIKQISTDENYYNVIINNTVNNTQTNVTNQVTNMTAVDLANQESREKVRLVASQLLDRLK